MEQVSLLATLPAVGNVTISYGIHFDRCGEIAHHTSICISLMANDAEHLFTCLFAICIHFAIKSSWMPCPFSNWFCLFVWLLDWRVLRVLYLFHVCLIGYDGVFTPMSTVQPSDQRLSRFPLEQRGKTTLGMPSSAMLYVGGAVVGGKTWRDLLVVSLLKPQALTRYLCFPHFRGLCCIMHSFQPSHVSAGQRTNQVSAILPMLAVKP